MTIKATKLIYEVVACQSVPEDWLAEAIDDADEGSVYAVRFSGKRAKERALEYAAWKSGTLVHLNVNLVDAGLRS